MISRRGRITLVLVCLVIGVVLNAQQFWVSRAPPHWPREALDPAAIDSVNRSRYFGVIVTVGFSEDYLIAEYQFGWPMCSMVALGSAPFKNLSMTWTGGWSAPRNVPWLNVQTGQVFPTGILWPGFIINTIFWGAIAWMLIRGPFEFRRRWREVRGRCGACGYPWGRSSVCTECGADLTRAWMRKA